MSMYNIYHSIAGAINIVFTAAFILLTIRFWHQTAGLTLIICLWFPLFHPLLILKGSQKQVKGLPNDLVLSFDDDGIHARTTSKEEDILWQQVSSVTEHADMMIIQTGKRHGYMLSSHILGEQKSEFRKYLYEKIKR